MLPVCVSWTAWYSQLVCVHHFSPASLFQAGGTGILALLTQNPLITNCVSNPNTSSRSTSPLLGICTQHGREATAAFTAVMLLSVDCALLQRHTSCTGQSTGSKQAVAGISKFKIQNLNTGMQEPDDQVASSYPGRSQGVQQVVVFAEV